jgi:uncharacterized protein (DUF952 family)
MVCPWACDVKIFRKLVRQPYEPNPEPIDRPPASGHDATMLIYKILRRPEWDAFRALGSTAGAPVDLTDGFIHFSAAPQLAETAARHFADQSDLVLLAFDAEALGADLKWEVSRGGALFPHLYRALNLSELVWDKSLPLGAAGHIFPEGVF